MRPRPAVPAAAAMATAVTASAALATAATAAAVTAAAAATAHEWNKCNTPDCGEGAPRAPHAAACTENCCKRIGCKVSAPSHTATTLHACSPVLLMRPGWMAWQQRQVTPDDGRNQAASSRSLAGGKLCTHPCMAKMALSACCENAGRSARASKSKSHIESRK